MGGIYSPILALLATAILVLQVLVQRAQAKHQFDHTFLSQSNADLEFYVVRLVQALEVKLSYGNTTRELLHAHYQPAELSALRTPAVTKLAGEIHCAAPAIASCWLAILPILQGFAAPNRQPYTRAYGSAMAKLTAALSYETCVSLDNYVMLHAGDRGRHLHLAFTPIPRT